ncbi:hypothetical protein J6590_029945 [Homalodisca vitripennis]|nr:hypothetical protein J6590_029945 [Homalodisca vitripennis]
MYDSRVSPYRIRVKGVLGMLTPALVTTAKSAQHKSPPARIPPGTTVTGYGEEVMWCAAHRLVAADKSD